MTVRLEGSAILAFSKIAGAMPWGTGQYPVARRYIESGRWPDNTFSRQTMSNGSRMSLDLGDATQLSAYMLRDFAPELTRFIGACCPRNGVFFDVGAHVGLVTFAIAARRPDIAIRSFEPNPSNIESWRRNHELNPDSRVELVASAVSDREGRARLTVPGDSGSGMLAAEGTEVTTVALDAYCAREGIRSVDVAKLDVEGHEAAVLDGARALLAAHAIGVVICEVKHSDRAKTDPAKILAGHGYHRVSIPQVGIFSMLSGRPHEQDAAFEP